MNSVQLIPFHRLVAVLILTAAVQVSALQVPQQVRRPPTIIKQADEFLYAIPQIGISLECAADALPAVKESNGYYWKKDGEILDISREGNVNNSSYVIIMSEEDGSITFNGSKQMTPDELLQFEGGYQCFARNKWGTAISRLIILKVATMVPYATPVNKVFKVNEGESAEVPCRKSSENDTETRWELSPEDNLPSERIAQALDGTLVFSNVVAEVDQGLQFYCTVKSLTTRSSIDGTHYTLSVNADKPAKNRRPEIIRPKNDNEERVVLRGDELKLICITVGFPTPSVYWTRGGKNLAEVDDDRYEIQDFNRTLYIRQLNFTDEGTYSCTAMNELGATRRAVNIIVQSKPYFPDEDKQPIDDVKVPGETATIKCAPYGIPPPTVEWMINGVPVDDIKENAKGVVLSDRIVVNNLNDSDTAVYQCVGRNKHGVVMGQGFLNVMTSPPVAYPDNPTFYRKMEETAVDLLCNMFGSPPPKYTWSKLEEKEKILLGDSRITPQENNAIEIKRLNLDDSGTYRCTATNEYGSKSINITLLVVGSTVVRPRADKGVYYATKGGEVVMGVQVNKHPNVTEKSVEWYKGGNMVGNNYELKLLNVKMQEGGIYKVLVNTDLDHASTDVRLVVQDVPEMPINLYFTVSEADNYTGILNWEKPYEDNNAAVEGYMIEYQATKLKPGVWMRIGEEIPGTETRAEVSLEPWVAYSFRVWARNKIGWSNVPSLATVPHQTPPKAPSINPINVRGKGTAPDNMVIKWDPVDPIKVAGPGFAYEVSWCLESSCNWTVKLIENASVTNYTVDGRSPYTRHLINVTSSNDKGRAPTPESVVGYSGEDVPTASPTIENYTIEDDGKVVIKWQPVPEEHMRGLVTGYQVVAANKNTNTHNEKFVEPNERRVEFDLEPFTEYEVTVIATNSAGASEPSQIIRFKTPESIPEEPVRFRVTKKTLTSLELYWEEPEKKNGIITEYSLQYEWEESGKVMTKKMRTKDLHMTIDGLEPDNTYYLTVCASTSRGFGTDCAQLSADTLAPKAPRKPIYDVITDDNLANISWTPAPEDKEEGMPPKLFYVQHRLAEDENDGWIDSYMVPTEPEKSQYDLTINDLTPGSRYEFRIIAINDYGNTTSNSTVYLTSGAQKQDIATGIVGQLWFIVVMCIVALIVLVIVIVCFARRRNGGKYSVSEKEEQFVKLESQAMNNDEAGKYSVNPNDDLATDENGGLKEPLQSRRTRGDSVGGNSIEAFGSGDTRGFEEDGSFIDQYGVDRRSHGKSEGMSSPGSDEVKDVSDAESKLLPESARG